ncbi:MAG: 50S ribosomal protein L22 [bacterium]
MKAFLKNYRQSPRKVRLLAGLVRGKKVDDALIQLDFANKRASVAMKKLIASAVANAKNNDKVDTDNLYIKEISVDKGVVLKRFMPVSRGMAHPIHKHTSRVTVVLGVKEAPATKKKPAAKKTTKKTTKK